MKGNNIYHLFIIYPQKKKKKFECKKKYKKKPKKKPSKPKFKINGLQTVTPFHLSSL